MMGRMVISLLMTTGRSLMLCMPRMALCGALRMGVESMEP